MPVPTQSFATSSQRLISSISISNANKEVEEIKNKKKAIKRIITRLNIF
jgi:hypothetical protein